MMKTNRRQTFKATAFVLLAVLLMGLCLGGQATGSVNYGDQFITKQTIFVNGVLLDPNTTPTIPYYSNFKVNFDFVLSDHVKKNDKMEINFPFGLKPDLPLSETFNLKAPDGTVMGIGLLQVNADGSSRIIITFNENVESLQQRTGSFYLDATMSTVSSGTQEILSKLTNDTTVYKVNRNPRPGTNPNETHLKLAEVQTDYPGQPGKTIYRWYIRVHAGPSVPDWNTSVTVTDTIGPYQVVLPHSASTAQNTYIRVRHFNPETDSGINNPMPNPNEFTITETKQGDVVTGFTVKFNVPVTRGYIIDYYVMLDRPTNEIPNSEIVNYYRVRADGVLDTNVVRASKKFSAGGDIGGIPNAQLVITKMNESSQPIYLNPATFSLVRTDG